MQPDNLRKLIVPVALAVLVTGFLLYVSIVALAPGFLRLLLVLQMVMSPFIVAIALALLLDPLVTALQLRRIPRIGAVLIIFLLVVGLLAASAAYIAPKAAVQVNQLILDAPGYYERLSEFIAGQLTRARPLLERLGLPATASDIAARFSDQIRMGAGAAGTFIVTELRQLVERSLWLVLTLLLTFMLLLDMNSLRSAALRLIPEAHRDRAQRVGGAVGNVFACYLRGLVIVCVLYALASVILFSVLGIRYSLLIGLAAGVLYAIPYLGAIVTALVVLVVSLFQHPDAVLLAFMFAGISLGLNQAFDMLITPRVVGGAVGLHPIISIFALMFGGAAFGIVGMLLAVPVAGSLQLVLRDLFPKLAEPMSNHERRPTRRKPSKRPRAKSRE